MFSDGEVTPFELTLTPGWESKPWNITSDGLSHIDAQRT